MVRKAVVDDVKKIHEIIELFAGKDAMLHRSETDIYDNIRDFFVYEKDGAIVGVSAMHISCDGMGEIRSLAVRSKYVRKGIGRALVEACLEEARSLGLKKVFALTYEAPFFHKLKFRTVSKDVFPQKVWGDCVRCVKFPHCDEMAVIIEL
ncbi:MAG: N-acetyltransferase [Thermodesulfobacteriota bacterium]